MPPVITRINGLAKQLRTPALVAYAITGFIAVASFVSTVLLARLSGAAVIGGYALAMSTAHLLATLAVLGLDRIIVREVGGDLRVGHHGRARQVTAAFLRAVALASAVVAIAWLLLLWASPLLAWVGGDPAAMALAAASAFVWPFARLGRAGVRATGSPILSQVLEAIPTVLFTAALAVGFLIHVGPTAAEAVAITTLGQAIAAVTAWALLRPAIRRWEKPVTPLDRTLLVAGLPFTSIMFLQIFADWILLAGLSATATPADVGAFRVAIQFITIIATIVSTTELYVAARFAGDFRAGRPDLAWQRHRRARWLMCAVAVPMVAAMVIAPARLLDIAFGPQFAGAATALAIMAAGQLVVALRGPIGSMLSMSGNDGIQLKLSIAGLALLVALAWWLVPLYGITGAAIAQAGPVVLRSVLSYLYARRYIPRRPAAPQINDADLPVEDEPQP